jgi:hypothetical protein
MTKGDPGTRSEGQDAHYRQATEELLHQLRWCVEYLYKIRKPDIARAIARNCDNIEQRLSDGR